MQKIQLNIPKPCMQDWAAMQPEENGKFCNACASTVIDFSGMSDAELLKFFSDKNNRNVCGRMHNDQVQTNLAPLRKNRKFYTGMMAFFIGCLLKWGDADAQKLQKEDVYVSPLHGQNRPFSTVHSIQLPGYAYQHEVSGILQDENGRALSGVRIQIKVPMNSATALQRENLI